MHTTFRESGSQFSHVSSCPFFKRCRLILFAAILLVTLVPRLHAQNETPGENLLIRAAQAATWNEGSTNIVQLEGPVSIDFDQSTLKADSAVIWLSPVRGSVLEEQRAEIALVGHASLEQPDGVSRSGDTLMITAIVRGTIRVTADQRVVKNLADSDLYRRAVTFRPGEQIPTPEGAIDNALIPRAWMTTPSTTQPAPTSQPKAMPPLQYSSENIEGTYTTDGFVAFVLSGNVKLFQRRATGEFLELQAQRVVLFTTLRDLSEVQKKKYKSVEEAINGAYLEGDVRIVLTPSPKKHAAEQRLTGERVYYDFTTDRAILTQAVIHTYNPKTLSPIILRAQTVRQLSAGEYTATRAQLTTSSFANPSFAIGLRKVYVRQMDSGDPRIGMYTEFTGEGATLELYKTPVFYFPYVAGTVGERGSVFRGVSTESNSRYGPSLITQWGLFESLGKLPPKKTDITYQVDYFGKRGPAVGIDGTYVGGTDSETTREPYSFNGDFSGLLVEDHGFDKLDNARPNVQPSTQNRGRFFLEHQYFLPDDWQAQFSVGYSSDPTFLEEWYEEQFYNRRPQETALYLKRQRDTEAATFLVTKQINNFPTASDVQQEQAEIERLPEIGYHRIGDGLLSDSLTFFSDDMVSGLDFRRSRATLAQQGFGPGQSPGQPSYGTTGEPGNIVYRGDFRQELDYPFTLGRFRVVPYVLGRYTVYSDSPMSGASKNRLYTGAGVRVNTSFWKVDDSVENALLDLHRLRHVIEPEVHLFTGAENVNRNRLFQYDESIDEISDISGAQLALRQRWETKRGDAGRWRSVDVFALNIEGNFFTHKPKDALSAPSNFRGLFFDSAPEESIPRNSVNADATWRLSDNTEIISDVEYNLDHRTIATASGGVAVQRGERISYFLGQRYIQPLNSNITTFAMNYQLTTKYTFSFQQSFDFGVQHTVATNLALIRHFDRFYASVSLRYDEIGNTSGFMVNLYPEGFGQAGTSGLHSVFSR